MMRATTSFSTDAHLSEQELATAMRQGSCYGWLQRRGGRLTGVIQGPRHLLSEVTSTIPTEDRMMASRPAAFSRVEVFPPINSLKLEGVPVDFEADAVAVFVGINHLGALRGWAVDLRNPMVSVRGTIRIDGEFAADFEAGDLRLDVAKAGFGSGLDGFYVQLPERWLDGGLHKIALRVPDRRVLGTRKVNRRLPIAPNLRTRPWIVAGPPTRAEELRQKVVSQQADWRVELGGLLNDLEPSACFRDWGVEEGFTRAGLKMPGIRDRMLERYGQWFSTIPCSKEAACCKHESQPLSVEAAKAGCPLWPRHFESKEFTKQYARSKGIRIPKTLAVTHTPEELIDEMGPRYVMKPENDSGRGLFLMHDGINLFDRTFYDNDALREAIQKYQADRGRRQFIFEELLVQEGVSEDAPVIPLDYKLHVFGGKVRMVHVDDRNTTRTKDPLFRQQGWYTRDWQRSPVRIRAAEYQGDLFNPPASYPEMLRLAESIGTEAKGVYLRIDFYATSDGPALGEVTTFSFGGNGFSPAGDGVMSALMEIYESDMDPSVGLSPTADPPGTPACCAIDGA